MIGERGSLRFASNPNVFTTSVSPLRGNEWTSSVKQTFLELFLSRMNPFNDSAGEASVAKVEMKFEIVVIPVSDVDRASARTLPGRLPARPRDFI